MKYCICKFVYTVNVICVFVFYSLSKPQMFAQTVSLMSLILPILVL